MNLWTEFLGSSWAREFVAGGVGGTAGVLAGYPLDTLRIRQQHSVKGSAFTILRHAVVKEGPCSLYRGMMAPLASIAFQNAIVFQTYAMFSRALDTTTPPSYTAVALAGTMTGAVQSFVISPIELVKIRLQLQQQQRQTNTHRGPLDVARTIIRSQGWRGIFRGLGVTMLRDAPSHGVYFWTYEYMKERLHPGCRRSGEETMRTMLLAGGLAGVSSWISCYPFDVIKTRVQADQSSSSYSGIKDCLARSVARDGYGVLWRGLGTAVGRAFFVNGVVFMAYGTTMRCMNSKKDC